MDGLSAFWEADPTNVRPARSWIEVNAKPRITWNIEHNQRECDG